MSGRCLIRRKYSLLKLQKIKFFSKKRPDVSESDPKESSEREVMAAKHWNLLNSFDMVNNPVHIA